MNNMLVHTHEGDKMVEVKKAFRYFDRILCIAKNIEGKGGRYRAYDYQTGLAIPCVFDRTINDTVEKCIKILNKAEKCKLKQAIDNYESLHPLTAHINTKSIKAKEYIAPEKIKIKAIYDAGENKAFDRYTVYYDIAEKQQDGKKLYSLLAMSDKPFHPQGFYQHGSGMLGRHNGRKIIFDDLPEDCQKAIRQDIGV